MADWSKHFLGVSLMNNRRELRARMLVSQIMHMVLAARNNDDLADSLYSAFIGCGAELVTDETRRAAGLALRGPEGWTLEELSLLEQRHLDLMRAPIILQTGVDNLHKDKR